METKSVSQVVTTSLDALSAPHADEHSVRAFDHAMSGDGSGGMGADILNELGRIKEQFTGAKKELQNSLSVAADDPNKIMELQYSLMRINLQQELIAKTVGRLTQNVETLMKAQ